MTDDGSALEVELARVETERDDALAELARVKAERDDHEAHLLASYRKGAFR